MGVTEREEREEREEQEEQEEEQGQVVALSALWQKQRYAPLPAALGLVRRGSRSSTPRSTTTATTIRTAEAEAVEAHACWDVIIVTAQDEEQRDVFANELASFFLRSLGHCARNAVSPDTRLHVLADSERGQPSNCENSSAALPPLGCGGSTLLALQFLEREYGDRVLHSGAGGSTHGWRVLLLHAGGFSKRLPNHSATGKIFSPVPLRERADEDEGVRDDALPATFLELKLSAYAAFPRRMPSGGVLVTCSDDFQIYDPELLDFSRPGFTALAIRGDLALGTGHGVFVLEDEEPGDRAPASASASAVATCRRFLHKPTFETMRAAGAVLPSGEGEAESIYLDSNFFFDADAAQKLLAYANQPDFAYDCEIDAYGDFLQPLGSDPTTAYFASERTTGGAVNSRLLKRRRELYEILVGTPLNIIRLDEARFVHVGTMPEYVEHYSDILPTLGFERVLAVAHSRDGQGRLVAWGDPRAPSSTPLPGARSCCILASVVPDNVSLSPGSTIEFSEFTRNSAVNDSVSVGSGCILSQVLVPFSVSAIPADTFLHTVSLSVEKLPADTGGATGPAFCTIALGINDDMKSGEGTLAGRAIDGEVFAAGVSDQIWSGSSRTIWNAKLFAVVRASDDSIAAVRAARQQSAALSLALISSTLPLAGSEAVHRISPADISELRHPALQLEQRRLLEQELGLCFLTRAFLDEHPVRSWIQHSVILRRFTATLSGYMAVKGQARSRTDVAGLREVYLRKLSNSTSLHLTSFVRELERSLVGTCSGTEFSPQRARAWSSCAVLCRELLDLVPEEYQSSTRTLLETLERDWKRAGERELARSIVWPLVAPDARPSWLWDALGGTERSEDADAPPLLHGRVLGAHCEDDSSQDSGIRYGVQMGGEGRSVLVSLPARIILAGGWSDTPPFCLEERAEIVNFAIDVDGERPIRVSLKIDTAPEWSIRIGSVDGQQSNLFNVESKAGIMDLFDFARPGDSLSLHKAAVALLFFGPLCVVDSDELAQRKDEVVDWCRARFVALLARWSDPPAQSSSRYCLTLETDVRLPQGSGLGTSSIIMHACVRAFRCLFADRSEERTRLLPNEVFDLEVNAVQALEQLLTTGGGWQDQVGGATPGLKHTVTDRGCELAYKVTPIPLSAGHISFFNQRLIVLWTGRTRVAKSILSHVVSHWVSRRSGVPELLAKIAANAGILARLFADFAAVDLSDEEKLEDSLAAIGRMISTSREANIELERSVTGDVVDGIIGLLSTSVSGVNVIGSGGGGYVVGLLKSGLSKESVAATIRESYPESDLANMMLSS